MKYDLISRSDAIRAVEMRKPYLLGDGRIGVDSAIQFLLNRPSVDAEIVCHGYNATAGHPSDQFICSHCGFACEITELRYDDEMDEYDAYEYDCKFCPECGAKMLK